MALAGDTRNGRMPSFAVEQGAGQGDGYCRQKKNASGLYSFSLAQNGGSGLGSVEVLRYKSEITKPRQGGKKKVEQTLSTVSCS